MSSVKTSPHIIMYAVLLIDLCGDWIFNTGKDAEERPGRWGNFYPESIRSGISTLIKQRLDSGSV